MALTLFRFNQFMPKKEPGGTHLSTMRVKILLSCIMLCTASVFAQDVITKTDGSTIQAKVEEVTESMVKYHRFDNPTGPLYAVPIKSIAKIDYENGASDVFGEVVPIMEGEVVKSTSDLVGQQEMNESELLRLAEKYDYQKGKDLTYYDYMKKASRYRKTAWIGGGAIAVIGIGVALYLGCDEDDYDYYLPIVGAPCVGAAAIWCLSWNLAANRQANIAKKLLGYSVPVIEHELFNANGTALAATVNLMGNDSWQNRNAGVGIGLNFKF